MSLGISENISGHDRRRSAGAVRLFGINIPGGKNIRSGLPLLYGIGKNNVINICNSLGISELRRFYDLGEDEIDLIRHHIEENYVVEGDLRGSRSADIKRLAAIGCYRGVMMRRGLPVRGQRTKTNARTRKGPKKSFGKK